MDQFNVYKLGQAGVNVDKDDIHTDDAEVRQAQNAIMDPLGVVGGLKNRPGLINFNASAAAGVILGGIGVPLLNLLSGQRIVYVGRDSI